MSSSTVTGSRRRRKRSQRLLGVDAARGLALLGMMTVHVFSTTHEYNHEPTWAGWLFTGRPSALFALLAGVGLALLSGGSDPDRPKDQVNWDRKAVAVRALLIILIGLAVAMMEANVAIILVHYGFLFLFALPFLRLGAMALFGIAVSWVALAPVAFWWVYNELAWQLENFPNDWRLWHSPSFEDLSTPGLTGLDLTVTGYYPLLIWPAYLFAGMALGRLKLDSAAIAQRLVLVGAALAIASYAVGRLVISQTSIVSDLDDGRGQDYVRGELLTGTILPIEHDTRWFLLATPHSSSTMDLLHTIGCGVLVLGICLLVAEKLKWPLTPLTGAGAMPLTLYVGHLVVLHYWHSEDNFLAEYSETQIMLILLAGVLAAGLLKSALGRRGPLEGLTHLAGSAVAGRRPGR